MVSAGFGVQLLVSAVLSQSYGAYVVVLRDHFGWNKTALAAGFSLFRLESGMLGPIEGWMIGRWGPRAVMRVGMAIFAAGLMLFSQVNSLTGFYIAMFVMAVGSSLGGFLPVTTAVVNWFRRRRATAIAITQAGFAVGGLVIPVVVLALETFGWRATAFGSGVLVLVAGMLLAQVIRTRPEDYGLTIDGVPAPPRGADGQPVTGDEGPEFTARQAVRTRAFWFIALGHAFALLVVSAVQVHIVAHLNEDLGYSLGAAALVVSLMTMVQMGGQLLGGLLGDRFNKRMVTASCMAMHMSGLLLVAYTSHIALIVAFAVLHGLAMGIRGPLLQAMRADYFGRSAFGMIVGLSTLVTMFGNILGPLVAGFLSDSTGSYKTGFTILALLAGMGTFFFLAATPPVPPGEPPRQESREKLSLPATT
jgi:sugar phosphate permease